MSHLLSTASKSCASQCNQMSYFGLSFKQLAFSDACNAWLKQWRRHILFPELNNKLNISAPKLVIMRVACNRQLL